MLTKFKDAYINNTILFDIIGAFGVYLINYFDGPILFYVNAKDVNTDILADIISASISLAGFILAALTIIVAFRSNIGNKPSDQARNPMELFFSNKNYTKVVKCFQVAIVELVIVFISSYLIWISVANFNNNLLIAILFALFFIISICIIRTLSVLYMVINIDKPNLT